MCGLYLAKTSTKEQQTLGASHFFGTEEIEEKKRANDAKVLHIVSATVLA